MPEAHTDIEARVRAAFADELCCPPALVRPDSPLTELPGLDSLKLLRVIAALETTLDVGLDDELFYSLRTVGDVTTLITDELLALAALTGRRRP